MHHCMSSRINRSPLMICVRQLICAMEEKASPSVTCYSSSSMWSAFLKEPVDMKLTEILWKDFKIAHKKFNARGCHMNWNKEDSKLILNAPCKIRLLEQNNSLNR